MTPSDPLRTRLIGTLWVIVPIWFVVISVIRLSTYLPYEPGYDGMLYRTATVSWMQGQDPWVAPVVGAAFAAPPPTLLAMVPFALVPEPVARVTLLVLGVVASVWMIRRLKLPIWWLAFPPLVDGLYIGNPHIFIAPLLVAGLAPIAGFLKLYALAVPALRPDRHPLQAVARDDEREVARAVESVPADLCRHDGLVGLQADFAHVQAHLHADELSVAPVSDRVGALELAAPVVDRSVRGEAAQERVGVVGVGGVDRVAHGAR